MMRVLVTGGTGHVGRALLDRLAGDDVLATHLTQDAPGGSARWLRLDLAQPGAADAVIAAMRGERPDAIVCCAGLDADVLASTDALAGAIRMQVELPIRLTEWLAEVPSATPRNVVLLGGLGAGQSFPIPAPYAAVGGAIAAAVMALGHSVARAGVRVNAVAMGVLDGGAGARMAPAAVADYTTFSAMRRLGTAKEISASLEWLIRKNTVINGKVLTSNGGI